MAYDPYRAVTEPESWLGPGGQPWGAAPPGYRGGRHRGGGGQRGHAYRGARGWGRGRGGYRGTKRAASHSGRSDTSYGPANKKEKVNNPGFALANMILISGSPQTPDVKHELIESVKFSYINTTLRIGRFTYVFDIQSHANEKGVSRSFKIDIPKNIVTYFDVEEILEYDFPQRQDQESGGKEEAGGADESDDVEMTAAAAATEEEGVTEAGTATGTETEAESSAEAGAPTTTPEATTGTKENTDENTDESNVAAADAEEKKGDEQQDKAEGENGERQPKTGPAFRKPRIVTKTEPLTLRVTFCVNAPVRVLQSNEYPLYPKEKLMAARIFILEFRRLRVKGKYDPKEFLETALQTGPLKDFSEKAWPPQALATRNDVVSRFVALARADVLQSAQPVECSQCGQLRPQRSIELHKTQDCSEREATCLACKEKMHHTKVKEHQQTDCPDYLIPCANKCKKRHPRKLTESHQAKCPAVKVDCKFGAIGCKVNIRRGQLNTHYNREAPKHVELLERKLLAVDAHQQAQEGRIAALEALLQEKGIMEPPPAVPVAEEPAVDVEEAAAQEMVDEEPVVVENGVE